MAEGSESPNAMTLYIARLRQSLDLDGDPENGTSIPLSAASSALAIDFDVSVAEFESNPSVIKLVANSGTVTSTSIETEIADDHLADTVNTLIGVDCPSNTGLKLWTEGLRFF